MAHVERQTLKPLLMIWAVTDEADLPGNWRELESRSFQILFTTAGSCAQRNAGLSALPDSTDIVAFFDDDYVPSSSCLSGVASFFAAYPHAVGVTGLLLADGIKTSGIPYLEALELIDAYTASYETTPPTLEDTEGLYGCNMAFDYDAVANERFDESLPLYAWQEDVDFAQRIRRRGAIGRTNAFFGVHQGVKNGRTSGVRLGYSQIANPIYLYKKGTMSARKMVPLILRNLISNHGRTLHPEPYIDRWGRVKGNWLAIRDLIRGRMHPERVLVL
jgi:GT2 family glycosyltransferase